MLNFCCFQQRNALIRGFTLIEMMVALTVGLIVLIGAGSLIVAINKANSETIQSTRLSQELRALAGVIADDIKRTRRVHDAIFYVGTGTTTSGPFDSLDTSTAGCIVYGYQDPTLNDPTSTAAAVNNYKAVRLQTTAGVGSVVFASGTAAVTCATAGTTLNSPQINITALTFSCANTGGTSRTCSEIDVTLTGEFVTSDPYMKNIKRTFTQPIFVRSGAVKTS
jgi:prepilin-type N-terminal cleavage/methylation domain-containing protein